MMKPKWPEDAMVHIASLQEDNDRLRNLLSEAEKREKEARAKALEEAAKVAWIEGWKSPDEISAAIRALQSEER